MINSKFFDNIKPLVALSLIILVILKHTISLKVSPDLLYLLSAIISGFMGIEMVKSKKITDIFTLYPHFLFY